MLKIPKFVVLVLCLVIAHCVWSDLAAAQVPLRPGCYRFFTSNDLGTDSGAPPPKLGVITYGNVAGSAGLDVWALPSAKCPPQDAPIEVCLACLKAAANAGQPISLATGNTYITQTDVRVPGLGGGLSLTRTWNSKWPSTQMDSRIGIFGPNWRSSYEERVFLGHDGYLKYSRSEGSFWSIAYGVTDTSIYEVAAPANQGGGAVMRDGGDVWTFTSQSGEQRIFDMTSGYLKAIIDRNGNKTELSYEENRLVTVKDPASRHLYFHYSSGANPRVTSVTSDVGISLSYAYDDAGRLIKVTNPDMSTVSFEYDDQSLITAVKDAHGKILESHTYDGLGRGLTSSRADGVEAITVSYPQP